MDTVVVVIRDNRDGTRRSVNVDVSNTNSIEDVVNKVSEIGRVPKERLQIVFGGRVLDSNTSLKCLLLGPTTNLLALVAADNTAPNPGHSYSSQSAASLPIQARVYDPEIGGFYVFCKECDLISRGKLRVYCTVCASPEVVVEREPSGWIDVVRRNRIPLRCVCCESESAFARFIFKCARCNEEAAALSHVRGNWESSECVVCAAAPKFVFDLGCNHPCCESCFASYVSTSLRAGQFRFKPPFGYTISCPATGCDFCATDVHHFRVAGKEVYADYQRIATEKLVALDDSGFFCPFVDCGSSFFVDEDEQDREFPIGGDRVQCPECSRLFCRKCREHNCRCQEEDLTRTIIQTTTKKCPNCRVDTERNGGCAHMTCSHCHFDWCWLCISEWKEECQWDHWFS